MYNKVYQAEFAEHPVRYMFLNADVRPYFSIWARPVDGFSYDVAVTPERLVHARSLLPPGYDDAYVEFRTLTELSSRFLLPFGCCFFHAVSFQWMGRAWLLTAPSGTGKTTQFLNWQRLHPEEISIICGDMPLLEQRSDGSVWVHSSPWNGKERFGRKKNVSAPLAGIVLLEQGSENRMIPLAPRDAVIPFFPQFIAFPETEEQILALANLMDHLLKSVPLWKLINLGDDASTELLRKAFLQELENRTGGEHDKV